MGHRLQNHMGKCRNLHGHTYRIEADFARLSGLVDMRAGTSGEGMVADFSPLKSVVALVVHDLDHAMVLQSGDPAIAACGPYAEVHVVSFPPTAELLAAWLLDAINSKLQRGTAVMQDIACVRLRLW